MESLNYLRSALGGDPHFVRLVKNTFLVVMKIIVNIACLMIKSTQHMSGKRSQVNETNVFIYQIMTQAFRAI